MHVVVGALCVDAREFRQFLVEGLGDGYAPLLLPCLGAQYVQVVELAGELVRIAQFCLQVAYLLVHEIFSLLAVQVGMCLCLHVLTHLGQLYLEVQELQQQGGTSQVGVLAYELRLFLGGEGEVGADEVHEEHSRGHLLDEFHHLHGYVLAHGGEALDALLYHLRGYGEFGLPVGALYLGYRCHVSHKPVRGFLQRVQSCAVECLEQGVVVAIGQLHQVDYPAYRAHVVEVVHARLVRFWVLLHEGGYQGAFLVGQFQCLQALLPAYGDGGHRAGKEYVVAQGQYAHVAVVALAYYLFYVGIYFCNE